MGFRVWDLGFRVWDLGFRVWDLGFRGIGFKVRTEYGNSLQWAYYNRLDMTILKILPNC